MSWDTAIADLRAILSDGPTDKYRYRKRCVGYVDGINTTFKTFEFRRITNLADCPDTKDIGVFVDGQKVKVLSDVPSSGEFVLRDAPTGSALVEATYYVQWFLDSELDIFLKFSAQWMSIGSNYLNTPIGLQQASVKYAAHEAYQKLALRWAETLTETYRVEDIPNANRMSLIQQYKDAAKLCLEDATKIRNDYYERQGQQLSPRFRSNWGAVREVTPKA